MGFVWTLSKGLSAENDIFSELKKIQLDSDNLMLVTGIPQMTLLMRDEVKVYINHCGANSFQEGIYSETPMLTYPGFGDQPINARELVENNMALPLHSLKAQQIIATIDKLMDKQKYKTMKESLKKHKDYMASFGGFQRGAEIVEKVAVGQLKVQKQPELHDVMKDQMYIIYMFVSALILIIMCSISILVYVCCRCRCCRCRCRCKRSKQKEN